MKKTILILVAVMTGWLAAGATLPDNDIDYLLRDATTPLRGDVNLDGRVNIGDVTTLINYLLSNEWPAPTYTYSIEKLWEVSDLSFMTTTEVRQGFGMNGKFYINDKTAKRILVVDEHGLTDTTYPGGANAAITRDEAGNLIVSNTTFPTPWEWNTPTITVINPNTDEVKTYAVPEKCGMSGRCDYLGFAKGNLMQDGTIAFSGYTSTGISVLAITGGEVNLDSSFNLICDGPEPSATTVVNYYTDLAGQEALLYVNRQPAPVKITFDGSDFVPTTILLPNKGFANGAFPFVWGDKELFLYATLPNYQDGFAVAEAGAEEPIATHAPTVTENANGFTADWLNAEVINEDEVIIYQYYPGGYIAVYRLTRS